MKTLLTFLTLLLPLCLMAQAPPVLRQSLDTNNADIAVTGRSPVWSGVKWVMVDTNTFGSGVTFGDLLWTNDNSVYRTTLHPTNFLIDFSSTPPDVGTIITSTGQTTDWFGKTELWAGTNYTFWKLTGETNAFTKVVWLQAGDGGQYLIMTDEGTERVVLSPDRTTLPYLFDTEGAYTDTTPLFAVRNNGGERFRVLAAGDSYFAHTLTTAGITNTGPHQHSVGAFTGALFVSSNANGVAYWSTNVNNIGVTNLSVYNNVIFNGSIISNFNRDINWTNDGVVLRTVLTNTSPPLRVGMAAGGASGLSGIPMSDFWRDTNVAVGSIGLGSNVLSRGRWGSVLGGTLNEIGTNATRSVIAGGDQNWIDTNAHTSFIGGGGKNSIRPAAGTGTGGFASVIGGGTNNIIQFGPTGGVGGGAFLGGGSDNSVNSNHVVLVGGFANLVRGDYATLGGGLNNTIGNSFAGVGTATVLMGGEQNSVAAGHHGVIGGGKQNSIGGTGTAGNYGFIGGGIGNSIAPTAVGTSSNAVVVGGTGNSVGADSDHAVVGGGENNDINSATNALISGGSQNAITGTSGRARGSVIAGGERNTISGYTDFNFILGSSNLVTTNWAGIIGWKATNNTTPYSITIAPQSEASKTIFTSSNLTVRTSFATVPDTVVTLTADNQVVNATLRTHIRLASDSAVAGDRTFLLTGTNVVSGAHAILEWTGTNAGELVDDSANSGAGNIRLSATWTPTQYDTLSLIFNGTDWVETARATN